MSHTPGLTLVDQATAIGFPPSAGFPQDDYNAPMSAILGSCVAVVIVVTAIIGTSADHGPSNDTGTCSCPFRMSALAAANMSAFSFG